ncbi:Uncharacterised protein g2000 [Pycnogonum litorale]
MKIIAIVAVILAFHSTDGQEPICEEQEDQINRMLEAHNVKRRLFNAGPVSAENGIFPEAATPIPDLIWNNGLATMAETNSDRCVFGHSTGRSLAPFSNIGENVYMSTKGLNADNPVCDCTTFTDWTAAVALWYAEIDDFASQDQICSVVNRFVSQQSPAIGHFTQVIWADTTELGCGAAFCMTSTQCSIIVTCNYGEAGNYRQEPVYMNGTCPPPQN